MRRPSSRSPWRSPPRFRCRRRYRRWVRGAGTTSGSARRRRPPSLNGPVTALNADAPGILLVGGSFTSAGGNANAARIATWNGTAWGALNGPPISNGGVFAIAYHAGRVYAGGTFVNAGGNPDADYLAVWDGASWAPFCTSTKPGPAFSGSVAALQVIGNTLFVGGAFQNGAGIDAADYLLACDLTTGAPSVDGRRGRRSQQRRLCPGRRQQRDPLCGRHVRQRGQDRRGRPRCRL